MFLYEYLTTVVQDSSEVTERLGCQSVMGLLIESSYFDRNNKRDGVMAEVKSRFVYLRGAQPTRMLTPRDQRVHVKII